MLRYEPLMELAVDVGEMVSLEEGPLGERRVVAILGGTFEGPGLDGEVLPGADWQLARRDGVLEIDARYALRERSGGIVLVLSQGYRHGPPEVLAALARGEAVDPAAYFFRTVMRFETGHERLAWLNRVIAIASGARRARQVLLSAHSLL